MTCAKVLSNIKREENRDGQRNRWRNCCILILDSTIRAVMLTFV